MSTSFARDVAYRRRAEFAGRHWRSVLSFVATSAGLIAVIIIVGRFAPALPVQLLVGIVVGATAMAVLIGLARFGDSQVLGHMAETFTAEAFRKRKRWYVTHHLRFEGLDVDTVVVTPGAVLAVETKWRHSTWSEAAVKRNAADRETARERARKVRLLLCTQHQLPVLVLPVLITWGPGAPSLPTGARQVDDVWEMDGDHPDLWLPKFDRGPIGSELRADVIRALDQFQQMRAKHDERSPSRHLRAEFLAGVRSELDERRARRHVGRAVATVELDAAPEPTV